LLTLLDIRTATVPFNKADELNDKAVSQGPATSLPENSKTSLSTEKSVPVEKNGPETATNHATNATNEHYTPNEKHISQNSANVEQTEQAVAAGDTVVDDGDEGGQEGAHYVTGLALALLAFGLCVTTFLIGLDQMIIATAIPKITTQFDSLGDVGW
jgi:hypothetical protein